MAQAHDLLKFLLIPTLPTHGLALDFTSEYSAVPGSVAWCFLALCFRNGSDIHLRDKLGNGVFDIASRRKRFILKGYRLLSPNTRQNAGAVLSRFWSSTPPFS